MEKMDKNKKAGLSISDKELGKWDDFLRKNNFLEDEIKDILSHLNKNYYKKIKSRERVIDGKVKELEDKIIKKCSCVLSKEEKKFLRELVADKEDPILKK